ncbi:PEP-CTERM sorting domain-containing protein [Luteolibacter luteus]|uniref:PEP-CTERM sorting domain-containing protein n=1 Tax=Luteolibacter luteus TaxID=2728835 RepID=A0A858RCZ1_9BACT|nr:PEP-CTERM sorting domain-containing protein [Luteolibacter luteus]QJE94555.1 PEP-CTERM sorting domain-containing protein [Luteolibacter luteus]
MSVASPLVGSNDSVERRDGSLNFGGWGSRYTLDKYVSFTVTTEPGFEATLTHISFKSFEDEGVGSRNPAPGITSFTLAYRVDRGTWNFGETYYTIPRGEIVWDFQDIQTGGTVEFALFATADFPGADLSIDTLNVYGTVPEPSGAILAGLSGAVTLRRRRRN